VATSPGASPDSVEVRHDRIYKAGASVAGGSSPFWQIVTTEGSPPMRWVGIDVSKDALDIAVWETALVRTWRTPNTAAGIEALLTSLRVEPSLARIAVEATGAYHAPLVSALVAAQLPTSLVNPAQVVAFRQTLLVRNKTDRADAVLLARFAQLYAAELRLLAPSTAQAAALRALVDYRETLVQRRVRLLGQREAAAWQGTPQVQSWLAADLEVLDTRLAEVEREVARGLAVLPEARILREVVGVGPRVAAAVLAYLPSAVWGHPKAAAACAGVHPRQADSGRTQHSRLSKAGSARLRRALYMAALVAIQRDATIRSYYDGLVARGKPKLVAVVAVMHKLLRQMMGKLRRYYQLQNSQPVVA
jgi:transposase